MTLDEKEAALKAELAKIGNGRERLAYVVARGRQRPPLDLARKRDDVLVEGCLSKLWFVPGFREGKCFFETDSDSAIVKGIATLICEFYSGSAPVEILAHDLSFLSDCGIAQHLTPNRRSGLGRLNEKIRAFAAAHMINSTSRP